MIGELVTLPLRISLRTASVFLRAGGEMLERVVALTERPGDAEARHRDDNLYDGDAAPSAPVAAPVAPPPPPPVQPPPQAERAPAQAPEVEEPAHVSQEPTIVEEFAEPGAEEGVGAQVTIDEPWDGYARLAAKEVIARIGDSDAAELAAVNLYESAHQARQTVLAAVERQLALTRRGGTPN